MTRTTLALALMLMFCATASAERPHGLDARDSAGVWTGLTTGTFQGQPYASVSVVTIADDGWSATVRDDSTLGPLASSCTVLRFSPAGDALAHCTFTSGVATGGTFDVHYLLTDRQRHLKLWVSNPALHAVSDLTQP